MIKHVKSVECLSVSPQPPWVVLFIPHNGIYISAQSLVFVKIWMTGHLRFLTGWCADQQITGILLAAVTTHLRYISVWELSRSKGYFLLQSGLITVSLLLWNGEQVHRPYSSLFLCPNMYGFSKKPMLSALVSGLDESYRDQCSVGWLSPW